MKYYLVQIEEKNGEQEYRQTCTMALNNKVDPDKAADDKARTWYGGEDGPGEKDGFGYSHLGGIIFVYVLSVEEIPKEDYLVLKKYNF